MNAQQPKRVVKFVFQTDKSGSIVKRIPVFEEEKEKKDLKILKRLSVKPLNAWLCKKMLKNLELH